MTRVALVVFQTLLLFTLAEAAARVVEWRYPGTSEIAFDYAPYRMLRMTKAPWPLNHEGFRARELASYRHTFLIEFLGGSVCLGIGTNAGKTVPERLEEALHEAGLRRAAVLNLCQGGATSAQELAILLQYGLPLAPQVVLSFDGANDLLHPRPVGDDESPNLPYLNAEIRSRFDHSFAAHLAFARVAARALPRQRREGPGVPVEEVLDSYFYSLQAAKVLAEARGSLYAVILQPSLHYQKPWSQKEKNMWGERAQTSRRAGEIYAAADTQLGHWRGDSFDLAAVFRDTRETVYSDSVHFVGERGYAMLFEELRRQGLVERIAARYRAWEEGMWQSRLP
jgi:hypothetical protein